MSKKKKNKKQDLSRFSLLDSRKSRLKGEETLVTKQSDQKSRFAYLRNHYWTIGLILLFALGMLGAGLKFLEEDAQRLKANKTLASNNENQSILNRINPFLSLPSPTPTPLLSKEYLYAGGSGRLLAAEDANANAAPPADLAIWRPSTGVWWVLGGQGSQQTAVQWGLNGDKPAIGDYDGDGKTDFSVYRPSEGNWYIQRSSDNTMSVYNFGISTDKMAQADFDGDGRTDAAVYRATDGMWYILRSSDSGVTYAQFGVSTDVPIPSDFDGDGKADVAVWRDSEAKFYIYRSSNNQVQTVQHGQTGDVPVVGDYDGDGQADFAVRRGADWVFLYSSNYQTQTINWQQSTDHVVQNDYDGDGKVDIAVWRESNGNWYIRKSSNGQLRQEQWGMAGDIPVPSFYRR